MPLGRHIVLSVGETMQFRNRLINLICVLVGVGIINSIRAYRRGGTSKVATSATIWLSAIVVGVVLELLLRRYKKKIDQDSEEDGGAKSYRWFWWFMRHEREVGGILFIIAVVTIGYTIGLLVGICTTVAAILLLFFYRQSVKGMRAAGRKGGKGSSMIGFCQGRTRICERETEIPLRSAARILQARS